MDCSLPGSSVHRILQARILEWVAMPSSRGSSLTQGSNPCLLHLLNWQASSLPLVGAGCRHAPTPNSGFIFPVVRYKCESWTIKKAECQRTDGSELWCWRRLLRVPWTARRSNQSILKEIRLMLKLKLQYFGHLLRRTDSLEKTLMLGKIEGRRKRG